MTKLGLSLLGVAVVSATAFAQPGPQRFTKSTSFQSCSTSWAFACGKRDASGRTFGTAHEVKRCYKYTFEPNGTYASIGDIGGTEYGTYKMIGGTVRMTPNSQNGTPAKSFDLALSPDGNSLGTMTKL